MSVLGLRKWNAEVIPFGDVIPQGDVSQYEENHFGIEPIKYNIFGDSADVTELIEGLSPIYMIDGGKYVTIIDYHRIYPDEARVNLQLIAFRDVVPIFNVTSYSNDSVAEWLEANTTEVKTVTLKAGSYKFNDVLTNFPTTTNIRYTGYSFELEGEALPLAFCNYDNYQYDSTDSNAIYDGFVFGLFSGRVIEPLYLVGSLQGTEYNGWLAPLEEVNALLGNISTDQEVTEDFGTWYIANTNYNEINAPKPLAEITYNGETIAQLNAGETATLPCKETVMASDLVVKSTVEIYDGKHKGGAEFEPGSVIEVDELPKENIDSSVVYSCGGVLYRYEATQTEAQYEWVKYRTSGSDDDDWFNDGNTHLWVRIPEKCTPMVGVCPNGTVTVDWGDGTTPDVLTGTSTSELKYTPNHNYAEAGDYVITLTVDGEMAITTDENGEITILRHSAECDDRNYAYWTRLKKVETGVGVVSIGEYAFNYYCYSLASVNITNDVTSISSFAFSDSYALKSVSVADGVTSIGDYAFSSCYSLTSFSIPNGVTSIGNNAFAWCSALANITIPDGVTSISDSAFTTCNSLVSVNIPSSVTNIGDNVFAYCSGVVYYDFTTHTSVPTLGSWVFDGIVEDCEIRVPAVLADEWKAAPNWSDYADYIVGV